LAPALGPAGLDAPARVAVPGRGGPLGMNETAAIVMASMWWQEEQERSWGMPTCTGGHSASRIDAMCVQKPYSNGK
jgi:hypothetical protein